MAAFAAVLTLNLMNLLLQQNSTRFKSNLLLLFINTVAFATDLLIYLHATPVVEAGNGRL